MSAVDSSSLRSANVTLEGWFNFAAVGGVRSLVGKTLGGADNDSYVLWHDAGQLRGGVGDAGGFTQVNGIWSPQLNTWYHLAYVFDDAATGQGLLNYFLRAINCGAITEAEALKLSGLTLAELRSASFVKILKNRQAL